MSLLNLLCRFLISNSYYDEKRILLLKTGKIKSKINQIKYYFLYILLIIYFLREKLLNMNSNSVLGHFLTNVSPKVRLISL